MSWHARNLLRMRSYVRGYYATGVGSPQLVMDMEYRIRETGAALIGHMS